MSPPYSPLVAFAKPDLKANRFLLYSCLFLELKSRKENFNRIMPDLEIDMHSNPFGDQDDPDNNFDQISVKTQRKIFSIELISIFS